jgi:putative peptidoglycan lipid II flippase
VPRSEPGVVALALGVLIGGLIQLAVQLPVAVRLGWRLRWRWRHPGSRQIMTLLGPRMLGAAVYQLSVFIHTALASLAVVVGEGAVAALYFANRLVQLPLALFGTASAQASLPALSEQAAREDLDGFRSTVLAVIRMVGFVVIPASVGLIVLAAPIVQGLFERGAFDHRATVMTSQALICYSLGLMAYAAAKVLTGAFYALQDTRTPVRLAMESVTANVVLSLALMWPLQVSGLALAAAAANTWNALRLLRGLERRLRSPLLVPVAQPLARICAASLVMGAGCWTMWRAGLSALPAWAGLTAAIGSGMLLYAGACALFRVQELSTVLRWIGHLTFLQTSANE